MLLAETLHGMGLTGFVVDGDRQLSAYKWESRVNEMPRFPVRVERICDCDEEALATFLDSHWWLDKEAGKKVDYVIIDTRPDLEDEMLRSAMRVADVLIIPLIPETSYVEALEPFTKLIRDTNAYRVSSDGKAADVPLDCKVLLTRVKTTDADAKEVLAGLPGALAMFREKRDVDLRVMDNVFKESTFVKRASNKKTGLQSFGKGKAVRAVQDNLKAIWEELA
ncbi:hypothetical protein AS149_13870 [Burkholderia cenocepacia]|nr:hypothetical protein AS149_13870 [Burkholderia cenocepacia]